MQKNQIFIICAVLIIAVGAVSFYGGYKYGQTKGRTGMPNFSAQGQNGFGQFGQRGNMSAGQVGQMGINGARRNGGGFVGGQVLSMDEKSLTIKSMDGGSKIVFISDSTQITKSASGTKGDLIKDSEVLVNGTTNDDGSITAKFIQIRPASEPGGVPMNPGQASGQIPEKNTGVEPK